MLELTNSDYAHFFFEDHDLEAQLIAIHGFLQRSSEVEAQEAAEIRKLAERAKAIGSDRVVGMYTDSVHASVYSGAAHSAAAVGMLAPFVENLFTVIFRGIGKQEDDYLGRERNSKRSKLARSLFWDPHFQYRAGEVKTNLVAGIMQLAEASRLAPLLPADTERVLDALFSYRNAMLHSGFEWAPEQRDKFAQRVKGWDPSWFLSAVSNGKPWVWYVSDIFIARVLKLIDEVLDGAGQFAKDSYYADA
jgi:hypothetical protein